jgi:hypothetical protein
MSNHVIRLATHSDINVLIEMRRDFTIEDLEPKQRNTRPGYEAKGVAVSKRRVFSLARRPDVPLPERSPEPLLWGRIEPLLRQIGSRCAQIRPSCNEPFLARTTPSLRSPRLR